MSRVITPEDLNTARRAPMKSRAERRARAKDLDLPFRPVYGYLGLPAPDHKAAVDALGMKGPDNRETIGFDWSEVTES